MNADLVDGEPVARDSSCDVLKLSLSAAWHGVSPGDLFAFRLPAHDDAVPEHCHYLVTATPQLSQHRD